MTYATAHNGGLCQTNFGDPVWYAGWFLADGFKYSQGLFIHPLNQDANGYPMVFGPSPYASVLWVPTQAQKPGQWYLRGVGKGTFAVAGTTYSPNTDGVWEFGPFTLPENLETDQDAYGGHWHMGGIPGNKVLWDISAKGTTSYISALHLVHQDDIVTFRAGDPFANHARLAFRAGKFGLIRMMGPLMTNNSNQGRWSDRATTTMLPQQRRYRNDAWAGTCTKTGSSDFTAPTQPSAWSHDGGGHPPHGATVHFDLGSTGTIGGNTLKIASGGVHPLKPQTGTDGDGNGWWYGLYPTASTTDANGAINCETATYDSNLGVWCLVNPGNPPDGYGHNGITVGYALEYLLQFCAEEGAHISINIPAHACVPATDYVDGFLTLAKTYTDACPWMKVYASPSNEVWNTGFLQTHLAYAVGQTFSSPGFYDAWYARALTNIGKRMTAILGTGSSRAQFKLECEVFTLSANLQRLVGQGSDANDRAIDYIDALAPSGYWTPNIYNSQEEMDLAFEACDPVTTTDRQLELTTTALGQDNTSQTYWLTQLAAWKNLIATNFPTKNLEYKIYEGGMGTNESHGGAGDQNRGYGIASISRPTSTSILVTMQAGCFVAPVGHKVAFSGLLGMTSLNGQTLTITARDLAALTMTFTTADNSGWSAHTADSGAAKFYASYNRPAKGNQTEGGPMSFQDIIGTFNNLVHKNPLVYERTIDFNSRQRKLGYTYPSAFGYASNGPWQINFPTEFEPITKANLPQAKGFADHRSDVVSFQSTW